MWNADGWRLEHVLRLWGELFVDCAYTLDGRGLIALSVRRRWLGDVRDWGVHRWDASTFARPVQAARGDGLEPRCLAMCGGSETVLVGGRRGGRGGRGAIVAVGPDGSTQTRIETEGPVGRIAVARDRPIAATWIWTGQDASVYVHAGESLAENKHIVNGHLGGDISSDGRLLAVGEEKGKIGLYKIDWRAEPSVPASQPDPSE